jgi:hypothetical protein
MKNCLRHPIREHLLAKTTLALDLVRWLCWLPLALRIYPVPALLKRLSGQMNYKSKPLLELPAAVEIVTRISHLRPFRSRIFPKQCLRQSLVLYRTLTRMGYPVEIYFGVMKDETSFRGHSWVTVEGKAVADTARGEIFNVIYSYSSLRSNLVASDRGAVERSKNIAVFNQA